MSCFWTLYLHKMEKKLKGSCMLLLNWLIQLKCWMLWYDFTLCQGVDFKIKQLIVGGKRLKLTIWDTGTSSVNYSSFLLNFTFLSSKVSDEACIVKIFSNIFYQSVSLPSMQQWDIQSKRKVWGTVHSKEVRGWLVITSPFPTLL